MELRGILLMAQPPLLARRGDRLTAWWVIALSEESGIVETKSST